MITAKDHRLFKIAFQVAQLSYCRQKHGAVIADGRNIISLACNKLRTHPVSYKWRGLSTKPGTCHAEQLAIIYAKRDISDLTLYSAHCNGLQKSRPCPMCATLMYEAGIRYVVYYNGLELIRERL